MNKPSDGGMKALSRAAGVIRYGGMALLAGLTGAVVAAVVLLIAKC